jgi:hypothetical protein
VNARVTVAFAGTALLVLASTVLISPGRASADVAAETTLAERYAPVVRLVEQAHECGPGEPYQPMDVDAVFGQPTVALRGPWSACTSTTWTIQGARSARAAATSAGRG